MRRERVASEQQQFAKNLFIRHKLVFIRLVLYHSTVYIMRSALRYCLLTVAAVWAKDSNLCEKLDSNMGATFDVTDLVR